MQRCPEGQLACSSQSPSSVRTRLIPARKARWPPGRAARSEPCWLAGFFEVGEGLVANGTQAAGSDETIRRQLGNGRRSSWRSKPRYRWYAGVGDGEETLFALHADAKGHAAASGCAVSGCATLIPRDSTRDSSLCPAPASLLILGAVDADERVLVLLGHPPVRAADGSTSS